MSAAIGLISLKRRARGHASPGRGFGPMRARARAARHVGRPPAIRRGGGPSRPSDGCRSVLVLSFQHLRRRAASRRTQPCARSAHHLDLLVPSRSSSPVVSGAQREQAFFPRAGGVPASCRPPYPRSRASLVAPARGNRRGLFRRPPRARAGGRVRGESATCDPLVPPGAVGARHCGLVSPQDESASPRVPAMAFRAAPLALRSSRRPGPQMPVRSV